MIIMGADHAGLKLKDGIKSYLTNLGHNIIDVGSYQIDKEDDFSRFILKIRECFNDNPNAQIIAVCGSGVGMNIGLNKTKNIRCVLGHNYNEVIMARKHNNVNALALGGRNISLFRAKKLVRAFLNTENLDGKYIKRMNEIEIKQL